MRVCILDGYVDEPSILGVPPFISSYPRYLAGAAKDAGHEVFYLTVDQWRNGKAIQGELLVVISGAVVPGKYLRGMPISQREIGQVAAKFPKTKILAGPLARFRFYDEGLAKAFDHLARRDPDACLYDYLTSGTFRDRDRTLKEWNRWAVMGAEVVTHHPDFPDPAILELDTTRGCVRYFSKGCSFCIEPLYGIPLFRTPEAVTREVRALARLGAVNFRLGGQTDFFSYMGEGLGRTLTPRPKPPVIAKLLRGIRKAAPRLKVLHTDNADPAVIMAHPEESRAAAKLLVKYGTSGNVVSFGMETADPNVVEANNLNATPEITMGAIELINEVGKERGETGLPRLLPGLNFVAGLDGETPGTYEKNLDFLKEVYRRGLMVRRINLRQVAPIRRDFDTRVARRHFRKFKARVRQEIDRAMLTRVAPEGTLLTNVLTELHEGKLTFGRQVGSYPILVGMPSRQPLGTRLDVKVTDHGPRSVTAVEYPLAINRVPYRVLEGLPGIGARRAMRLFRRRPFANKSELASALDDSGLVDRVAPFLSFA